MSFNPAMEYGEKEVNKKNWVEKTSSAAPTIMGVAAGIMLGDMMHRGARRPVAFSLACLGMLALTPSVVGAVKKKVAGPQTKRGSRKTLDGIRNAGVPEENGEGYLGDDLSEDMHIV